MKLRIATAAALSAGFAVWATRFRGNRLRIVAEDGSIVRSKVSRRTRPAPSKLHAVAVLSTVRARDAVGVRLGWRDGEAATDALVVEMTGDLATVINGRSSHAV